MSEPFLGQISVTSFNFPPKGWAFCNGQLLPINQNQALFALLGTTYGGDGRVNFALPNLQGRVPLHRGVSPDGTSFSLGQSGGEQSHTLTISELPTHGHLSGSVNQAITTTPDSEALAARPRRGQSRYTSGSGIAFNDGAPPIGGSQAHSNLQPLLVLTYIIALQGIFPSQT